MSLIPCFSCGGTGRVKQFHAPCLPNSPWRIRENECPTCGGSGKTTRPIGFIDTEKSERKGESQ